MRNEVLALIVVYGQTPIKTMSFQTLAATKKTSVKIRLLIWDNSPEHHDIRECLALHFEEADYISTPENNGLSTIYNVVIKNYLKHNEFLLLLDQDSMIPIDFFEQFSRCSNQHPEIDLFLPTIRANNRLVSPLPYFYGWGICWKTPRIGIQYSKFRSAINSGMMISGRYLKGDFSGYDERLRFYGTDTQFMDSYARSRREFFILDAIIDHDLSFYGAASKHKASKFLEMKIACMLIYENHPRYQRALNITIMYIASIKYALKYKSLSFLKKNRS